MKFSPADFRLLVGVHTHGTITPPFAQSLATLAGQLAVWGVTHAVSVVQDAFVTSGRDALARMCVKGGFTHLLFLDADLEFAPEHVGALLAADKDVIAAAYRRKNDSGEFATSFLLGGSAPYDPDCAAIEVDGTGTGFMLIRRQVFERMAREMPEIRYVDASDGTQVERHAFFEQKILADGHRASEDILFCRRWRALGGQVWVRTDIELTHWGPRGYTGRLAESLGISKAS